MPDTPDWLGQPPPAVTDAIAVVQQACTAWPKAPAGTSLAQQPIGLEAIVCRVLLESAHAVTIGALHDAIALTVAVGRPVAAAAAGAAASLAAVLVLVSFVARAVRRRRRAALVLRYEARIARLEAENLALTGRFGQPGRSAA